MSEENLVDHKFLDAMGVKMKWHQPWQVSLFVDEFSGKFVWYPNKGTLMVDYGEYNCKKLGEFTDTEDMYNAMMAIVYKK